MFQQRPVQFEQDRQDVQDVYLGPTGLSRTGPKTILVILLILLILLILFLRMSRLSAHRERT